MKCNHNNCTIEMHTKVITEAAVQDGEIAMQMHDGEPTFMYYLVWCKDCKREFKYSKNFPRWLRDYVERT